MFRRLLLVHCFWSELNKMQLEIQPKLLLLKEQCQNSYVLAFGVVTLHVFMSGLAESHYSSTILIENFPSLPGNLLWTRGLACVRLASGIINWTAGSHYCCLPEDHSGSGRITVCYFDWEEVNAYALKMWLLAVSTETIISIVSTIHTLGLVERCIKYPPFSCPCTAPSLAKTKIKHPLTNQLLLMLTCQDVKCTQVQ